MHECGPEPQITDSKDFFDDIKSGIGEIDPYGADLLETLTTKRNTIKRPHTMLTNSKLEKL
jgi:hypothetical protein